MTAIERPWIDICAIDSIPVRGCRIVQTQRGQTQRGQTQRGQIAVFRTARDEVFALENRCPHKGGPLSEGILHGRQVTCPLHNWIINLEDGEATGADKGRARSFPVRLQDGRVYLSVNLAAAS